MLNFLHILALTDEGLGVDGVVVRACGVIGNFLEFVVVVDQRGDIVERFLSKLDTLDFLGRSKKQSKNRSLGQEMRFHFIFI